MRYPIRNVPTPSRHKSTLAIELLRAIEPREIGVFRRALPWPGCPVECISGHVTPLQSASHGERLRPRVFPCIVRRR